MDEGDRRAPVALARDAPVAQAVLRLAAAPAFVLCLGDDRRLRFRDVHPVEPFGIHDPAWSGIGHVAVEGAAGFLAFGHHPGDR